MAVDTIESASRFEIGRVIRRMFDVIGKNLVSFAALSLIFSLPYLAFAFRDLLVTYFHIPYQPWLLPASQVGRYVNAMSSFAISQVFQNLSEATIAYGMMATLSGGKASFAECLAAGLKSAGPLTAIALIEFAVIVLGLIVLVVPGIIVALMFSVAAPVRVMEHTGISDTLNRSTNLTSGHRAQIFALFVVYYLLAIGISFSVSLLARLPTFSVGSTSYVLGFLALSACSVAFLGLLSAAGIASIYYELRLTKEGYVPERLAAVFA